MTLADLIALLADRPLFVQVVTWIGITMILGVAGALAYIVLLRVRLRYMERQMRIVRNVWLPLFAEFRGGHRPELPRVHARQYQYLLELWVEERGLADEEFARALDQLALEVGLDDTICRTLQLHQMVIVRRKIWMQSIALTAAEWIDTAETRKAVTRMVGSDNYFIAAKACACLVKLDAESAEQEIIGTLFRFPKHAPYISVQLSEAGASSVLHVLEPFFDLLPRYAEMNFVSLLERTDDVTLLPMLLARLESTKEEEERAAILRAIGRIGSEEQREAVLAYLDDPIAMIRIQAIKTLGKIGRGEDRELLLPHLSDPDWWIRYRAARSYIRLSPDIHEEFERLIASLSDRYAQDILRHALVELEWWTR